MKNKLILLNFMSYFLISFIILNVIHFISNDLESIKSLFAYEKFIMASIISIVSLLFYYILNRWYLVENIFKIFLRYAFVFIFVNMILILILYLMNYLFFIGYLVTYFSLPLVIIVILTFPIYLLTKFFLKKNIKTPSHN